MVVLWKDCDDEPAAEAFDVNDDDFDWLRDPEEGNTGSAVTHEAAVAAAAPSGTSTGTEAHVNGKPLIGASLAPQAIAPAADVGAIAAEAAMNHASSDVAVAHADAGPAEEPVVSDDVVDSNVPAVQVCVRVRPLLGWERADGHEASLLQLSRAESGEIALLQAGREDVSEAGTSSVVKAKTFCFDKVFGPDASQQDVCEQVKLRSYVAKVLDGFNATVFAYGQTGSGKTHSMEGFPYDVRGSQVAPSLDMKCPRGPVDSVPPEQLGIVPRAIRSLFASLAKENAFKGSVDASSLDAQPDETVCVRLSYMQIYKERIFDLLNPATLSNASSFGVGRDGRRDANKDGGAGLRLRWDVARGQFFVENLFEFECSSAEEAMEHYVNGLRHKKMAATTMNNASSRSHSLLVLTLVRRTMLGGAEHSMGTSGRPAYSEIVSKLTLVDLAGSERAGAHTQSIPSDASTGEARFKEAVNINQSLMVLRKVISALAKRDSGKELSFKHIPYRESKLTSLLKHSIGGNGHMLMLACLSPSDKYAEENLSTLKYATAAACIKNRPVKNLDPKDHLIQHLQEQLDAAHAYILREQGLDELPDELQELARRGPAAPPRGGAHKRRRSRGSSLQARNVVRAAAQQRSSAESANPASSSCAVPPPCNRKPPAPPLQRARHPQQQWHQTWQHQQHSHQHPSSSSGHPGSVGLQGIGSMANTDEPSDLYLSLRQRSAEQRSCRALSARSVSERVLPPLAPPVARSASERVLPPLSPPVTDTGKTERVLPPLAPPMSHQAHDDEAEDAHGGASSATPDRHGVAVAERCASAPCSVETKQLPPSEDFAKEMARIGLAASPLVQLAVKCAADPMAMKKELEAELFAAQNRVEELKANLQKVMLNLPKSSSGYLNFERCDTVIACPPVPG